MLREEEDDAAALAGVVLWDVEVEDCALVWGDVAVVLRAEGLVGLRLGDWHNQVGGLMGAIDVGWASGTLGLCRLAGGWCWCWLALCRLAWSWSSLDNGSWCGLRLSDDLGRLHARRSRLRCRLAGRRCRFRGRSRWLRCVASSALATGAESDFNAVLLVGDWNGVDVVLLVVRSGGTSVELGAAIVLDSSIVSNREATSGCCTLVTLELSGWWC